jgi:hypothetical protein
MRKRQNAAHGNGQLTNRLREWRFWKKGSEWMHSLDVALAIFVEALVDFPAARLYVPERDGAGQHDSDNNQDCDKQHDTPPVFYRLDWMEAGGLPSTRQARVAW